jgi:hypothetical protein
MERIEGMGSKEHVDGEVKEDQRRKKVKFDGPDEENRDRETGNCYERLYSMLFIACFFSFIYSIEMTILS